MVILTVKVILGSAPTAVGKFLQSLSNENCVTCWMITMLHSSKRFLKSSAGMRSGIQFWSIADEIGNKFRQRWEMILPNSWTVHLFENIGMPVFSATHSLKMEETRALSKPASSNSEWVCPLHRLKFFGKRTQTRPAFRKGKTRAWRRLPIALLHTAYTVCRSLSIRTMPVKVVVPPWTLSF